VIDYYIVNDAGVVVSLMRGPRCLFDDALANNPGRVFEGVADVGQILCADGGVLTSPRAPTYTEQRKAAYPEVGDQLDALWKTLKNLPPNLLTDEAQQMLTAIDAVKTQIPKDSA